jgi:hypothetical protein
MPSSRGSRVPEAAHAREKREGRQAGRATHRPDRVREQLDHRQGEQRAARRSLVRPAARSRTPSRSSATPRTRLEVDPAVGRDSRGEGPSGTGGKRRAKAHPLAPERHESPTVLGRPEAPRARRHGDDGEEPEEIATAPILESPMEDDLTPPSSGARPEVAEQVRVGAQRFPPAEPGLAPSGRRQESGRASRGGIGGRMTTGEHGWTSQSAAAR